MDCDSIVKNWSLSCSGVIVGAEVASAPDTGGQVLGTGGKLGA